MAVRTPEEMRTLQLDLSSGLALRWKGLAADGAKAAGLEDEARMLAAWDGRMTGDSKAAALFSTWWRSLPRAIFEDELGAEDADTGRVLLDEALTTRTPAIDDRRTPHVETLPEISGRAMQKAKALAHGRTWGEVCTLRVQHPLGFLTLVAVSLLTRERTNDVARA